MTTPRITVPVEPEGVSPVYTAAYDSIRKGAPGLSDATCAAIARSINMKVSISAAPAPEGGAARGPGGYLVKDFADGWYWTPNAALDHASGAPIWSVSEGRYETDPPAIATREEAPAEGEDAEAVVRRWANWIIDESSDMDCDDHDAGKRKIGAERDFILSALRAQPPAREDAQPVAWVKALEDLKSYHPEDEDLAIIKQKVVAVFEAAHPAPDALRVAVEALEPFARLELPKKPVGNAGAWSLLHSDIRRAKEALAALQAEQGAK